MRLLARPDGIRRRVEYTAVWWVIVLAVVGVLLVLALMIAIAAIIIQQLFAYSSLLRSKRECLSQ